MSSYSALWDELNQVRYYKQEIYSLSETLFSQLELSGYIYAGSPNGGPIAFMKDYRKAVRINSVLEANRIYVYSSSGQRVCEFSTKECGKIVNIGWDKADRLICVSVDSKIHIFTMFGDKIKEITVLKSVQSISNVVLSCIWETGVAIFNQSGDILITSLFLKQSPTLYLKPEIECQYLDIDVIRSKFSNSRTPEILLSTSTGELLTCSDSKIETQNISDTIVKFTLSPNGKILAYFTKNGKLVVTTLAHDQIFLEFDTKTICPTNLVWCGADSILCYWESRHLLLMIGPNNGVVKYLYNGPVCLIPEIDGIRIFSNDSCDFLSRVPDVVESIFRIGSDSPSSMLFEAYQYFKQRDSKADKILRSIKGNLDEAITNCLMAAGHEFDLTRQNSLINAASLGKSYVKEYDHDYFAEIGCNIRILNQIRNYLIAIPMTFNQFQKIGVERLILKLLNHRKHLLSFKISQYLKIDPKRVIEEWACDKIKFPNRENEKDDYMLYDEIMEKVQETNSKISFVKVARVAKECNKKQLAIKLINHDVHPSNAVPLLLSMGENKIALNESINSGDNDLIFLVLFHLLKKVEYNEMTNIQLFSQLGNHKKAIEQLIIYWKKTEDDNLPMLLDALERVYEIAMLNLEKAVTSTTHEERFKFLKESSNIFEKCKHNFSKSMIDDQFKLMGIQKELEKKTRVNFFGKSVNETISIMIQNNDMKTAKKMKKQFKINDRRYWWLVISTLAKFRMWEKLRLFSESKNSPIGYEPFVRVCLKNFAKKEAVKYIPKIKSIRKRAEIYFQLKMLQLATEAATQLKDEEMLNKINSYKEKVERNRLKKIHKH
ncbi:vacuolar protein sorting vps16 [Anaeramoeba flamelloides]|uniref:Vacuolar protein sorting vps16 n=1 Tax=Anaeramoeba flamelloides TaxID=1746091 RepID=A0AAV7ZIU2_9EUKA|nr:vacuolar protein sorting vps16 [Anaeramoeba flamelloides]